MKCNKNPTSDIYFDIFCQVVLFSFSKEINWSVKDYVAMLQIFIWLSLRLSGCHFLLCPVNYSYIVVAPVSVTMKVTQATSDGITFWEVALDKLATKHHEHCARNISKNITKDKHITKRVYRERLHFIIFIWSTERIF